MCPRYGVRLSPEVRWGEDRERSGSSIFSSRSDLKDREVLPTVETERDGPLGGPDDLVVPETPNKYLGLKHVLRGTNDGLFEDLLESEREEKTCVRKQLFPLICLSSPSDYT